MSAREKENRELLADLFAGPFRGHAITVSPEPVEPEPSGDLLYPDRPLEEWVDYGLKVYEARVKRLEALGDDSVPDVNPLTGTEVFAAAFGSPIYLPEGSRPHAMPVVATAEEADSLPEPDINAPPLERIFAYTERVHQKAGPEVPLRVPDIQSPFDIATLVWRKEELLVAMYDNPEAVKRLVDKCHRLLTSFLTEFKRRFPNCNLCHCPYAWAPPELGCWLSEDEAGAMSTAMFEEFCLPSLVELSNTFGGLFVHCCATADHQYPSLGKIPNLRGLNRVFQEPGPRPAIEAFSGQTVLLVAWYSEETICEMLDMALPDTRFLFNMPAQPLDEAKRTYERLRELCPRTS